VARQPSSNSQFLYGGSISGVQVSLGKNRSRTFWQMSQSPSETSGLKPETNPYFLASRISRIAFVRPSLNRSCLTFDRRFSRLSSSWESKSSAASGVNNRPRLTTIGLRQWGQFLDRLGGGSISWEHWGQLDIVATLALGMDALKPHYPSMQQGSQSLARNAGGSVRAQVPGHRGRSRWTTSNSMPQSTAPIG